MFVKELQPGDSFVQVIDGAAIRFEVVAIRSLGRNYHVTFRSAAGEDSASYSGRAVITSTVH